MRKTCRLVSGAIIVWLPLPLFIDRLQGYSTATFTLKASGQIHCTLSPAEHRPIADFAITSRTRLQIGSDCQTEQPRDTILRSLAGFRAYLLSLIHDERRFPIHLLQSAPLLSNSGIGNCLIKSDLRKMADVEMQDASAAGSEKAKIVSKTTKPGAVEATGDSKKRFEVKKV